RGCTGHCRAADLDMIENEFRGFCLVQRQPGIRDCRDRRVAVAPHLEAVRPLPTQHAMRRRAELVQKCLDVGFELIVARRGESGPYDREREHHTCRSPPYPKSHRHFLCYQLTRTITEIVKVTGTERRGRWPVTAIWPTNDNCRFPDRPGLAPRAASARHRKADRAMAVRCRSTPSARCMGLPPLARGAPANKAGSIPKAISPTKRRSPNSGSAKKEAAKRRPKAEGRMPMRARARERAHAGEAKRQFCRKR